MFSCVMSAQGYTLFNTPIGPCGIVWSDTAVVGMQLPERNGPTARARIQRRHPTAREAPVPGHIQPVIDSVLALLGGEKRDLSDIPVDLTSLSPFQQRLYQTLRSVPPGATISYGELATRLGDGATARDVGEAMGQNPVPIIVPCHRVLASGGKLGGFSAAGGVATKVRLLEIEGAPIGEAPTLFGDLPLAAKPGRR
ncbi:MAG TPA: methylated-DNA--[protein]-cysteine S-methyltransferase [Acetobacteraceae bacterium]|jgi:methylated-DNA-[protein]-cysteine S-methyltransferase|nr:methylated-DNA--[protein]-cysteine S-methyltransferase [Acetobacteraceae bacterium]